MVIWEDIFLNIVKWNGQHINKFDSLQKTQIPFPSWIPEIINLIRWIRNLRCQGTDIACIQRTALKITFQQQKKITGRRWKRKKPGFPRSVCDDQQKRCPIPPWDIFLWGKKNFQGQACSPRANFKNVSQKDPCYQYQKVDPQMERIQ